MVPTRASIKTIPVASLTNDPEATAVLSQFKDNTDPKYIGPGTWFYIHKTARKAVTHAAQLEFIKTMNAICSEFPCTVCRGHCSLYIKNHPMEEYLDTVVEINGEKLLLGMFVWSWKFHNAVNARTKKPLMSWDTAFNLYSEKESLVCSKECLSAGAPVDGTEHSAPPARAVIPPVKRATVNTAIKPFKMIPNTR